MKIFLASYSFIYATNLQFVQQDKRVLGVRMISPYRRQRCGRPSHQHSKGEVVGACQHREKEQEELHTVDSSEIPPIFFETGKSLLLYGIKSRPNRGWGMGGHLHTINFCFLFFLGYQATQSYSSALGDAIVTIVSSIAKTYRSNCLLQCTLGQNIGIGQQSVVYILTDKHRVLNSLLVV